MSDEAAADGEGSSGRDALKAARGGGIKFVGSLFFTTGGFVLQIILTRFLGAEHFGRYRLGVLSSELAGTLSVLGLSSSILRFVPIAKKSADAARLRGILQVCIGVPAAVSTLAGILFFVFAGTLAEGIFGDPELTPVLRVLAPAVPLFTLLLLGEYTTRAFGRIRDAVLGSDVTFRATHILAAAAILGAGWGLAGATWAYLLSVAAGALAFAVLLHRVFPLRGFFQPAQRPVAEIRGQSAPTFVTRLLAAFGGRLEALVLGVFGMTASVGVYSVALQMTRTGQVFSMALSNVSMPMISEYYAQGGIERLRPFYRTATRWSLTASLPLILPLLLFPEPLLALFGEEFVEGRTGLVLLSLSPLINAATGVSGAIVGMTGHTRLLAVNGFLYLASTIALDLLLIPRYGVVGAAIAATATVLVLNVLRLAEVFALFRLWPYDRHFVKPVLAASIGAGLALALERALEWPHPLVAALVCSGLLGAVYLGVLLALGFTEEDRLVLDRLGARVGLGRRRRPGA